MSSWAKKALILLLQEFLVDRTTFSSASMLDKRILELCKRIGGG